MEGTTDITDIVFEEREVKEEESVDAKELSAEEAKERNPNNNLSTKVRDGSDDSTSAEAKNGGGVFNTLISSILHPNGGADEGQGTAAADERERGSDTDVGDGGGGLIDNIASHLPDDAAPDTEEASMLIHSVVRD